MNQFVILSFGVDPLNWPSFIEIGEIACSAPAWCTHGLTLKMPRQPTATKPRMRSEFSFVSLYHDYSNLLTLSNASDPLWR